MKHIADFLLRAVLLILLGTPAPLLVLADSDHDKARHLLRSGDILSLQVILEKLRPQYSGTVLEVELERKSGRLIYELEILNKDGVVHKLYVDASTGTVLRSKVDD